jgi:hypothetical protein
MKEDTSEVKVHHSYFWVLLLLLILFCLRVLGQMLVAFFHVSFLPPMKEWYSGLMPYPELLPAQFLIILLFSRICLDFFRGRGYFVSSHHRLGKGLHWFGWIYFVSMIVRYILRMSLYPEARWFGGCIPIVFHCVLASYLLTMSSYYRRTPRQSGTANSNS